jgi:hypothetical protein
MNEVSSAIFEGRCIAFTFNGALGNFNNFKASFWQ